MTKRVQQILYYKYKYNKLGLKNEKGELYKYVTNEVLEEIKNHPDYVFENGKWKYIGILDCRKNIHWLIRKAYRSWLAQGNRCNNPNDVAYKYYGGKDKPVKRIWNSRIMVNFWINEFFKRKYWIYPVLSRFKDKGDYKLGNCILEENIENISKIKSTELMQKTRSKNGLKNSKKS